MSRALWLGLNHRRLSLSRVRRASATVAASTGFRYLAQVFVVPKVVTVVGKITSDSKRRDTDKVPVGILTGQKEEAAAAFNRSIMHKSASQHILFLA